MADQVLYSGVACITDLMVKEGLINLDFADVRAVMREMGKAMMGTGEASGEKRALTAAEAAIANPLIDDASMKGAKGLLISITGGRDLTLYEVDEAATRIREEVDQDANIIVGATFDESLEGIIRVSVVATGIDQVAGSRPAPAPEVRLAEITQKLRADQQRLAERVERTERGAHRARGARCPSAGRPPPAPIRREAIESAAKAAVAAAVLAPMTAIEDVTIRPIQPKPSLFPDRLPASRRPPSRPRRAAFIPPQPERPARRAGRGCRASTNCRSRRRTSCAPSAASRRHEHPEKRRMGLLQRLASVGLGRRDARGAADAGPARPWRRPPPRPPSASGAAPARARPPAAGPRAAGAGLRLCQAAGAPGARPARPPDPVHNSVEEDQLDIPAFLRRQAN